MSKVKSQLTLFLNRYLFLLSTLVPAAAFAATEEFEITIPAQQGMLINLEHSFGNLEVRQGADDQVRIVGSKLAESGNQKVAQEFLDEIELRISEDSNQIDIVTVYPNIGFSLFRKNKVTNRGMSYSIEIPVGSKLIVGLRFGDIELSRLRGEFKIEARQATIQALELQGDVSIRGVYGSITVDSIDGAVVINGGEVSVNINNVSGNVGLHNKFGSSEIRNIQGSVETSGEITPILADTIGGSLSVSTYASTVVVNEVQKNVEVIAKESEVRVTNVHADVSVENKEGSIAIDQVGGNIHVETAIGPVSIRNANEDITVNGRTTDLILEKVYTRVSERPRLMNLTTSLGYLKLELPADISATLHATTVRRQIHANFPVFLQDSPADRPAISAEFGDKKDLIKITGTENVEITLTKL